MIKPSGLIALICFATLPHQAKFQNYNPEDRLDFCLDSKYHKVTPGPEDDLHHQCSPWRNRSCCTTQTTIDAHYNSLYNFDYNHCSHVGYMSDKCKRHFTQDLCFYECSPNIGPWMVKINQSFRRERFMNVPLCYSDCNAWFQDCANDFTCTDNWGRNFEWKNGVNICPAQSSCKTFREIYQTPDYFCERVWDHSWKVVSDKEHCMRLWFDGSNGNPNQEVAKWKVNQLKKRYGQPPNNGASSDTNVALRYNFVISLLAMQIGLLKWIVKQ